MSRRGIESSERSSCQHIWGLLDIVDNRDSEIGAFDVDLE